MFKKTVKLLFFLKQSKNQSDDRFIYLKITVNGLSMNYQQNGNVTSRNGAQLRVRSKAIISRRKN